MKTSHTPGPWTTTGIVIENNLDPLHVLITSGVKYIGRSEYGSTYKELEANARLIASAPDLLAALRDVLRYCVTPKGMPDKGKGRTNEQQAACDAARAAIAAATREAQS